MTRENGSPKGPPDELPVPPSSPKSEWLTSVKAVILQFLPKPLKDIVDRGLVRALLLLVVVIVGLPPFIILLAAFWLKQLGDTDIRFLKDLRRDYLQVLYEGFSIEEVAARSNVRLDYYQFFEFTLTARTPSKTFRISIHPRQKALLDIKNISLTAINPTCSLPETNIQLVSVLLGEQLVRTLGPDDSNTAKAVGSKDWWNTNAEKLDSEEPVQPLSFKLSEEARTLQCGQVTFVGSLRVFKDLFEPETHGRKK